MIHELVWNFIAFMRNWLALFAGRSECFFFALRSSRLRRGVFNPYFHTDVIVEAG